MLSLSFDTLRRPCAVLAVALAFGLPAFCSSSATASDGAPLAADAAPKSVAKIAVQVTGRVKNAGDYALDDGARLSDALAAAGAFAVVRAETTLLVEAGRSCTFGEPDLHRVFLVRASTKSASEHLAYQIDVTNARERHDLRFDPLLRNNDKIVVPECRPTPILISHPPHLR